ncbi:MAG TPA: hypothetical protein VK028_13255 [Micromonosporaceae bacterium]|nr:hypothetical protein [Micromonosporaceae bacterium]
MPLEFVACPEPTCRAPAEVLDRVRLYSTSGAMEHVKTVCVRRHYFLVPASHRWIGGQPWLSAL